jgi:hypothetical protein
LCRAWAEDPALVEIVGPEPSWEAPLQVLAGMHYLVLGGEASWDDSPAAHAEFLSEFVRTQSVQTNEVQRSWVLGPLFCRVAQRTGAGEIDLVELGPSAGLNLVWDRYRCVYERGVFWGEDSPLELRGVERSPVGASLLRSRPRVRRRIGIDRSPIDVTAADGRRLLKSFVWADQSARLERLEAALAVAADHAPELVTGDFVDCLPEVLANRPGDVLTVVYQTAALGYVEPARRERVRRTLDDAGVELPLAFVSAGNPRTGVMDWGLRIVYWPGGGREFAGHADYHGAWIDLEL